MAAVSNEGCSARMMSFMAALTSGNGCHTAPLQKIAADSVCARLRALLDDGHFDPRSPEGPSNYRRL